MATDHGRPVLLRPKDFAVAERGGGWGAFAESFLRTNERALEMLDVRPLLGAGEDGVQVRLQPGGRAGAIPLRSPQAERVVGGLIVKPRFGWAGVGRVLHTTGWTAAPELIEMPLVPGSGREVPPWVIAGPVLHRLGELLASMRRGYRDAEEVLQRPRGRILWHRYRHESLARGRWHQLPCRFPDLAADPLLRRFIRWTLERVYRNLLETGVGDPMAQHLAGEASRLLELVADATAAPPTRRALDQVLHQERLIGHVLEHGIQAISWVYDERGLGGGRELDGLAWHLPLDRAWEAYVEGIVREEVAKTGGQIKVARLRQTVFPLLWSDPIHRSLGHLEPDIVVTRGREVHVVDAKYKAHLAELDEHGWRRFTEDAREHHRADLHQVLAYASLFDADQVRATLMYPLRKGTYRALAERGRDRSRASLSYGGRLVEVELRGAPFGVG
ncbi:MAG: hypothetical protein GY719_37840 [bacterium]|nr:hypothetical protein [bacterium]